MHNLQVFCTFQNFTTGAPSLLTIADRGAPRQHHPTTQYTTINPTRIILIAIIIHGMQFN